MLFNWLLILCQFNLRPSYFIFNKNDNCFREVEIPIKVNKKKTSLAKIIKVVNKKEKALVEIESVKFLHFLDDKKNSFSFKLNDKGGLNVAFEQIKK